jgi:hypothetical protein
VLVVGHQYDPSLSQAAPLRVLAYERASGSEAWSGPIVLSGPVSDYNESNVALAANERGEALVAWTSTQRYGDLPVTHAALRRTDGSWESVQNLGYGGYLPPSVAIDARGDAVAVWTRDVSPPIVYAEFRPAGGSWGPATVLSEGGGATVHMNRRGEALAVWVASTSTGHFGLVSSFLSAGTSSWAPPSPIPTHDPTGGAGYYGIPFALDEAGQATLVGEHGNGEVEVLTRPAAGDWTEPVALDDAGSSDIALDSYCVQPEVAVDATGDAVVVWGGADLRAARRQAGSSGWQPTQIAAQGPACFQLALDVDPAGNAVAVWNASEEAATQLDASVLDVTPPVLTKLVAPRKARARRRVRFSVATSDLWSSVKSQPLWRFGDGTSRYGTAVDHVFRRPGRYRVGVTATDQAGNTTASIATVRVTSK